MKTFNEKKVNQEATKKLFDCENVVNDTERETTDFKNTVRNAANVVKDKSSEFINRAMNDEKLQQKIGQVAIGMFVCKLFRRIF